MQTRTTSLPQPAPRETDPTALAAEIVERLTYRIGKNAVAAQPHDWLTTMGGSIGFGLPTSVGAAIGAPGRKVITLEGDGSLRRMALTRVRPAGVSPTTWTWVAPVSGCAGPGRRSTCPGPKVPRHWTTWCCARPKGRTLSMRS